MEKNGEKVTAEGKGCTGFISQDKMRVSLEKECGKIIALTQFFFIIIGSLVPDETG